MNFRIAVHVLLGTALVTAIVFGWPSPPVMGEPTTGTDSPSAAHYVGVASCSSMACHHGNDTRKRVGSEYTIWAAEDRHARAFSVLHNERSQRMVRNLHGSDAKPATETTLCLKCHATGEGAPQTVGERSIRTDGVGCESCHGAASKYLSVHYAKVDDDKGGKILFRDLPANVKATKYGLRDLKNLTVRAKLCTECHVGDANKDVNHDLIAAGHPRLNFELAGYHGIYAKHWKPEKNEIKLWALGQIISAKASLELLKARATDDKKPWPEFSESNCFSCHKDLQVESARQQGYKPGDNPGSLPWNFWYMTMATQYAQMSDPVEGKKIADAVQRIRKRMESGAPDNKAVAAEVANALPLLDAWLAREQGKKYTPDTAKRDLQTLLKVEDKEANAMDWDRATQLYLALAALHVGLKEIDGAPQNADAFSKELNGLGMRLRSSFPPGYDSPRDFDPSRPPLSDSLNLLRRDLGN